jgi:hypothetical protein
MLLPVDEVERALARAHEMPTFALGQAYIAEAEAILTSDPDRARAAAERYSEIQMPYEEARCRISAGDLASARELAERHGFQNGPLAEAIASGGVTIF